MRTPRTPLGLSLCLGLLAGLQLSCSSEPTSTAESTPEPSLAVIDPFTITGPVAIGSDVRRNYNYIATVNAFYVSFSFWGTRFCPTTALTCTAPWAQHQGTRLSDTQNQYVQSLVRDCTGGGTKSFQVRITATAFGMGTVTKSFVTKLCGKSTDPL
jgi:hypothetical protein